MEIAGRLHAVAGVRSRPAHRAYIHPAHLGGRHLTVVLRDYPRAQEDTHVHPMRFECPDVRPGEKGGREQEEWDRRYERSEGVT